MKKLISVNINDKEYEVAVSPNQTLVDLIRNDLELTGTKKGCELGDCGSCTVIMDGKPVNSCLVLAAQANGKKNYHHRGCCRRRGTSSDSGSIRGTRGDPVRVLQPRDDPFRKKSSGVEPQTDRPGDSHGHFGKSVPLYRVPENR